MQLENMLQSLKQELDRVPDAGERVKVVADGVADYYGLRSHEVGLFRVNHKMQEISFVYPVGMGKAGHIPLNFVQSLVARTAKELVPVVDNDFVKTRHLFMLEHMLADKEERITMQKVMSVPIIADGKARGVIQVGRKADSLAEAGADFTQQNLADLVQIAALLADYDFS